MLGEACEEGPEPLAVPVLACGDYGADVGVEVGESAQAAHDGPVGRPEPGEGGDEGVERVERVRGGEDLGEVAHLARGGQVVAERLEQAGLGAELVVDGGIPGGEEQPVGEAAIVVDDLAKSYGALVALDGIGFEVAPGTVTGLLGPNGSGKTTTVAILATALRPDSGVARVYGRDVVRGPAGVRQIIGFAGQFAAVDANLTGKENLVLIGRLSRLGREKARRHAVELAERFGLTDAADRLVRTYSGGMRRRLDIAAALVHRPPVIFLDEPTTGLDPESRLWLWETVRELVAGGTTALLTTQYLEEADALADEVVIIEHGRVVEVGTPAALKARVGTAVVELT